MAFRQGLGEIVMMKSILTPEYARSQLRGVVLGRGETIRNIGKDGVSVASSLVLAIQGVTCERPELVFLLGWGKNRMAQDVESRMSNHRKRSLSTKPQPRIGTD